MFQQVGGVLVVALADQHRAHTIITVLVHLFQNLGKHPRFAARFKEKVDCAIFGAAAQNAHVQPPGNKAHHAADPSGFGKVIKAGQGKHNVPFLCPVGQLNADGIKVGSYPDQLVGQLCCTGQCAGTAQGIQHKNLLFGMFFQHHLPRGQRGVVAARKIMADGQRNAFVRHQKQLGPFFRAGAGGGAGAVIIRHGLQHGFGVQGRQVHKLALANANLEWNQCKLNPRCSVRQGTDLTRRVRCDHPFHKKSSCNAGKKLRNQPEQSGIFLAHSWPPCRGGANPQTADTIF